MNAAPPHIAAWPVFGNKVVMLALTLFLILFLGFSSSARSEEEVVQKFRDLFAILESGDSIDGVLDRTTWPRHDLLTSYLELELLLHPRYKMTTERMRQFTQKWPTHAHAGQLRHELEERIIKIGNDAELLAWYDTYRPKTQKAKLRYLQLLLEQHRQQDALPVWRSLYQEGAIFSSFIASNTSSFEKQLTVAEHDARAKKLVSTGPDPEFQQALQYLPTARQTYLRALDAAMHGTEELFETLLKKLSPTEASNTELWDAKAKSLYNAGNNQAFMRFLLGTESAKMSDSSRQLLRFHMGKKYYIEHDLSAAIAILQANILEAGGKLQDSLWLAAWSAHLRGDRKKALAWFGQLGMEGATSPFRAQGAYWAFMLSDTREEKARWLAVAAKYPDSFYGLLAREKHKGALKMLPETTLHCPTIENAELKRKLDDLKLLKAVGKGYYLGEEISKLADQHQLSQKDQLCLAQALEAADLEIQLANRVEHEGPPIWSALYPIPDWIPMRGWKLDPALVWAVTRQESLFEHRSESATKALGLMQLMPATAQEEAQRIGLPPSNQYQLLLPTYNTELGQSYLLRMLQHFDGDMVLAVAAYNAGPGRGNQWKSRRDKEDPITFIETIPFAETRTYVKRVLFGLAMYRLRMYGSASLEEFLAPGKRPIPMLVEE